MAAVTNVDSIVEFAVYLQQSLLDENQGVNDLTVYLDALPLSHNDNRDPAVLGDEGGKATNTTSHTGIKIGLQKAAVKTNLLQMIRQNVQYVFCTFWKVGADDEGTADVQVRFRYTSGIQ